MEAAFGITSWAGPTMNYRNVSPKEVERTAETKAEPVTMAPHCVTSCSVPKVKKSLAMTSTAKSLSCRREYVHSDYFEINVLIKHRHGHYFLQDYSAK